MSSWSGGALGYPDIVLPGAARSGTSFLTARLAAHPMIDNGAIKEPNFFSRHLDNGVGWYDGLYQPRRPDLLRLDASMSYAVPEFPDALAAVAVASPEARVIFAVRDPIERAISHYRLLKDYLKREDQADFGSALRSNDVYLGAGDYERWLDLLVSLWGRDRLLVIPFAVTTEGATATDQVFSWLGLEPIELTDATGSEHRNEVVQFRHDSVRRIRKALRRTPVYPWLRRTLGPDRMRSLRSMATRPPDVLSDEQALASCSTEQLADIDALATRSRAAVATALVAQDERLGLDWADAWRTSSGAPVSGAS